MGGRVYSSQLGSSNSVLMASLVKPAQVAPPEGLWEVDVVKPKVKSKEL